MKFLRCKRMVTIACLLLACSVSAAAAPAQAHRSAYIQALYNLQQARVLLDLDKRSEVRVDRDHASQSIDQAIREIRSGIREKSNAPPPQLGHGGPDQPMRAALALLNEAVNDVLHGGAPADMIQFQMRTLNEIENARQSLLHALRQTEKRR
jgi:hypothetical protein